MKKLFPLLILSITFSCNKLENKVIGSWSIEMLEGNYDILTNGLNLKKDHTVILPMTDVSEPNTEMETGTWKVYHKGDKEFLEINTPNFKFNREYEVKNYRRVLDTISYGYLIKVTFQS